MFLGGFRVLGAHCRFKCYIDTIDYDTTIEQGKEGEKEEGWNLGSVLLGHRWGYIVVFSRTSKTTRKRNLAGQANERREG
jgi:hypothetical protein